MGKNKYKTVKQTVVQTTQKKNKRNLDNDDLTESGPLPSKRGKNFEPNSTKAKSKELNLRSRTVNLILNQTKDHDTSNNNAIPEFNSVIENSYIDRTMEEGEICDGEMERNEVHDLDQLDDEYRIDKVRVTLNDEEYSEFPEGDYESEDSDDEEFHEQDTTVQSSVENEVSFKIPKRTVSNDMNKFDQYKGDPAFEKYVKKMVAEEMKIERQRANKLGKGKVVQTSDAGQGKTGVKVGSTPNRKGMKGQINDKVKSPSDTTLYAPGLNKIQDASKAVRNIILMNEGTSHCDDQRVIVDQNLVPDQIANFIQGIRIEGTTQKEITGAGDQNLDQPRPGTSRDGYGSQNDEQIDKAKQKATEMILNAERYKAVVNAPTGMDVNQLDGIDNVVRSGNAYNLFNDQNVLSGQSIQNVQAIPSQDVQVALDDDSFFHATCHIDQLTKMKIEKGEFIDLEKLLPKQRGHISFGDDNQRLTLVQKDGQAYFVPSGSQHKINGIRRWEQAFRIYATIYSQANPSRAAEIWQYVHIINVAASAYVWDNVAYYDATFRHLMAQNPARNWSKIYNNMWNLAMREPIMRQNTFAQGGGSNFRQNGGFSGGNNSGKRKPKYCWGFNRASGCKDGEGKCKFIHRCSYCDTGTDHNKTNCPTKNNK